MQTDSICIRKAELPDADNIFWLLHSESIPWSIEGIRAQISNIVVMLCQDKLIGATCCDVKASQTEFLWTAIHPMYPEKAMSGILHDSLINTRFYPNSFELMPCHQ